MWNLVAGIRKDLKQAREAKKHKLPPPTFSVGVIAPGPSSLLLTVFVLPFGVLPVVAVSSFIRALGAKNVAWVLPLGAATDVLGIVVILLALFFIAADAASQGTFLTLERDVLLEGLSPSEIRTRFIRETLGPAVGEWLETLHRNRQQAFSKLKDLAESLRPRVDEVESINQEFPFERGGRARKLLEELEAGVNAYAEELRGFAFQVSQLKETRLTTWETSILTRIVQDLTTLHDPKTGAALPTLELRQRLQALANQNQRN